MDDRKITLFRRFVVMQQNHWAVYTILYLLMISTAIKEQAEAPRTLMWMIVGIIPFILCMVRTYLDNLWGFWGVHIAMFTAVLLLPEANTLYKLVFTGGGIFYCVSSVLKRYKGDDTEQSVPIVIPGAVIFVAMIFLEYLKNYDFQRNYIYLFILNIVLFFITKFVDRFCEYLHVNKHSVGYMPVKNIFFGDVKAILLFLAVMSVFFLLVIHFEEMNGQMKYVTHYLGMLVAACIKLLKNLFKGKGIEESVIDSKVEDSGFETMMRETQTNPIWDIILTILVTVLMAYALFKIIRVLLMVLGYFKLPQKTVEAENENADVLEICENIERNRKKRLNLFKVLSPEEQIRRSYKKKIQVSREIISAEGKRSEMELYTARECSDILTIPQIGDIYEKARYSPYGCTVEDAKSMKKACTNIRKD